MQKQKDVRIKQKLKSGFLRVAILAAIVGVVGIADSSQQLSNQSSEEAKAMESAKNELVEQFVLRS